MPAEDSSGAQVVAQDLRTPWAIDFKGEVLYISERPGSIVMVENGQASRQQVSLKKKLYQEGEAGFLGFALHPEDHGETKAFSYYTYEEDGEIFGRVVTLILGESVWEETALLLDRIPGAIFHNGGRLAIGPDGMLYVTTGDARQDKLSQDKSSLAGKILRMTLTGEVPDDNPIPGSYIYSYGHRNPQGLAWTQDGVLYSSEHGPSGSPGGHDELNRILPGTNYGWPLIIGDEEKDGMQPPLYHTGDVALAPSGMTADSSGRLLVATLLGQRIIRYTPDSGSDSGQSQVEVLLQNLGRIRDIRLHQGSFLFITNNTDGRGTPQAGDDKLYRMNL